MRVKHKIGGDRHHFAENFDDRVVVRIQLFVLVLHHFDPGVDEEQAKKDHRPEESFQHRGSDRNEGGAEDQRPQYAPEQNAVLILGRNLEVAKDQEKDEYVVYTQRFFNEITR